MSNPIVLVSFITAVSTITAAIIGTVAGIIGTLIANRFQMKRDQLTALRTFRQQEYARIRDACSQMAAAAQTRYRTVSVAKEDPRKRNEYAERALPRMGEDSEAMYRVLVVENGTQNIRDCYETSVDATKAFWRGIGGDDIRQRVSNEEIQRLEKEAQAKLAALEEAIRAYLAERKRELETD